MPAGSRAYKCTEVFWDEDELEKLVVISSEATKSAKKKSEQEPLADLVRKHDPHSMYLRYKAGVISEEDKEKLIDILNKKAITGDINSIKLLAEVGPITQEDKHKLLEKARLIHIAKAESLSPEDAFYEFRGFRHNWEKLTYLCSAADLGYPEAQYQVALSHWFGHYGFNKDDMRAYIWFYLAGSNGYPDARDLVRSAL